MRDKEGFDIWAGAYDLDVRIVDEEDSYPFAGYKEILKTIYNRIVKVPEAKVLDIGFGTGTLSSKLAEKGCEIWGQDFSKQMILRAREKMPNAKLYEGDFSQGLHPDILNQKFDFIVSTYALHHLSDEQKVILLEQLLDLLKPNGVIYIGDVAFKSEEHMLRCQRRAKDQWDSAEFYFVFDRICKDFPEIQFEPFSHCAGLFELR